MSSLNAELLKVQQLLLSQSRLLGTAAGVLVENQCQAFVQMIGHLHCLPIDEATTLSDTLVGGPWTIEQKAQLSHAISLKLSHVTSANAAVSRRRGLQTLLHFGLYWTQDDATHFADTTIDLHAKLCTRAVTISEMIGLELPTDDTVKDVIACVLVCADEHPTAKLQYSLVHEYKKNLKAAFKARPRNADITWIQEYPSSRAAFTQFLAQLYHGKLMFDFAALDQPRIMSLRSSIPSKSTNRLIREGCPGSQREMMNMLGALLTHVNGPGTSRDIMLGAGRSDSRVALEMHEATRAASDTLFGARRPRLALSDAVSERPRSRSPDKPSASPATPAPLLVNEPQPTPQKFSPAEQVERLRAAMQGRTDARADDKAIADSIGSNNDMGNGSNGRGRGSGRGKNCKVGNKGGGSKGSGSKGGSKGSGSKGSGGKGGSKGSKGRGTVISGTRPLGCPKCRYLDNGCGQCRDPGYVPRLTKAEWQAKQASKSKDVKKLAMKKK
jgi:hypothetical protein